MSASRSLIALLVGTVVFFALWLVALKPSSSSNGGSSSSHGLGAYQTDINKAKQAVATSNASNAASGNENATSSSGGATASHPSAKPAATPSAKSLAKTATQPGSALANALATVELGVVKASLSSHKVVALLFFNPLAADDRAVLHELALVPTHKGHVVKLAVPLSFASAFTPVTQQVPVNFSPTLMLISPDGQSSEVVGFATSFEISHRVDDALAG